MTQREYDLLVAAVLGNPAGRQLLATFRNPLRKKLSDALDRAYRYFHTGNWA